MKIIPKLNRVLLELVKLDGDSPIVLPDNLSADNYMTWKVKAIGDPRVLESGKELPIKLEVGDEVIINPRYSVDINCADPDDENFGKPMKVCDYAGIIAVVQRDPKDKKAKLGKLVLATPEIE